MVELSIVLVILGLLTGGILAGQSLIRASELRSVSVDFKRYQAAVQSFRDKYFALPGDMANATAFWGLAGGTTAANDATCDAVVTTGSATCNGDGDGHVYSMGENLHFWQQLANAGLIEGQFTGTVGAGISPGVNLPAGKIANTEYLATWKGPFAGNIGGFAADYGHYIDFLKVGFSSAVAGSGSLLPQEAWNIDTKLDDGLPGTGKIYARYWNAACANSTTFSDYAGTYRLTDTSAQCALYFAKAF